MLPGTAWWGRHVLARSLCRARRVPLVGIAPADRWGRLRVEAATWRPFDDCEHVAQLQGDAAWLYAWDRAAFERRCADAAVPRVARVVPETLLFPPPAADGPRLLACAEGVVGECWQGGAMLATRWWPAPPDAGDWALFQRSAGLPAAPGPVPPPATLPADAGPRAAAWRHARRLSEPAGAAAGLAAPWVLPALAAALALPAAMLGRDLWSVHQERAALEAELATLQQRDAGPLRARQEALAALGDIEAVGDWLGAADPVRLLAEVARRLPADGSVVRRFEVADGKLRIALVPAAGTPRVAYVRALEEGGWLADLREEGGEGREAGLLVLHARVAAPAAAASSPGPAASAAASASAPVTAGGRP